MSDIELALWKANADHWRKAATAWQHWAGELLAQHGLQPTGGEWGDEPARELLAELLERVTTHGAPTRAESESE